MKQLNVRSDDSAGRFNVRDGEAGGRRRRSAPGTSGLWSDQPLVAVSGATTGFRYFAVCLGHAVNPSGHTAKISSSLRVAHGEAPTATTDTAKAEFAVCQISGTRQTTLPCVCQGTRRKKARRRRERNLTVSG